MLQFFVKMFQELMKHVTKKQRTLRFSKAVAALRVRKEELLEILRLQSWKLLLVFGATVAIFFLTFGVAVMKVFEKLLRIRHSAPCSTAV